MDDSPRESEPNVGAWVATTVGSGVGNADVELIVEAPIRPVRSFGGGISPTFEDGWPNGVAV